MERMIEYPCIFNKLLKTVVPANISCSSSCPATTKIYESDDSIRQWGAPTPKTAHRDFSAACKGRTRSHFSRLKIRQFCDVIKHRVLFLLSLNK